MWGRIKPDKLGRPTYLWISTRARKQFGEKPYAFEAMADGSCIVITPDREGQVLNKGGYVNIASVLQSLNQRKQLSGEPFPIRKKHAGFEAMVYENDPGLKGSIADGSALPMKFTPTQFRVAGLRVEDIVKHYALAEIVLGKPISKEERSAEEEPMLMELPSVEICISKFGAWSRMKAFVDYQKEKYLAQGITSERAKTLLGEELLSRE